MINVVESVGYQDPINYYDDHQHDYADFWVGRDYEHLSEIIALNTLLKSKQYELAMDYGGGYGRLTPTIAQYAHRVMLLDPSSKQLNLAKERLKNIPSLEFELLKSSDTIPMPDSSLDLFVMVRVSHHIPDMTATVAEITRVLKPGGNAVIEIANYGHALNRLRLIRHGKSLPKESVEIGEIANGVHDDTPFVNHNPATIEKLLRKNKLRIVKKLSVSNFRNPRLKGFVRLRYLMAAETFVQNKVAGLNFGPSIFFFVEKPVEGRSK